MEDIQIIDLFLERNKTAIHEASKKYTHFCFGIAWNILSNKEDSEECVNDTWFATWKCIPPKKPAVLSSFLGKITRGFAIDCLRKKYAAKRMDKHMEDIAGELENLDGTLSYTLDEYMEEKELIQIINKFLQGLSETDRDIFIRRYWYMDSIKDIAKRHGISLSGAKSKLFRCRNKLQNKIEDEAAGERRIV